MARAQTRSKRKVTGGRYSKLYRKKKQYEVGSVPTLTKVAALKAKRTRVMGGNTKNKLLSSDIVNVVKDGKCIKAKITSVIENNANRNFVVRNIITKGSIVETDQGKAVITNRPGQEGTLNGEFIK